MIKLNKDDAVDWWRVIQDINDSGTSIKSLSRLMGHPYPTVRSWKEGARPRFEDGFRLIIFWTHVCDKEFAETPIRPDADLLR